MAIAPNFFEKLKPFTRFEKLGEDGHYVPAPADWFLVISDIQGSTKAIESGRYKDVNTLGAASIATVHNALKGHEFPFVFGGDGATFLIPPEAIESVKQVLRRLKGLAQSEFSMSLRVGVIQLREVYAAAQKVDVAKYELCPKKNIALIRGGGLSWAESKIKGDPHTYCLPEPEDGPLHEIEGLSCRWKPFDSRHGSILSLLIAPTTHSMPKVLGEVLEKITHMFPAGLEAANPVQPVSFKYKSFLECVKGEYHYHHKRLSPRFFKRVFEIAICVWAFRFKLPAPFASNEYVSSIPAHSDYRKLDDTLRMILDCTAEQAAYIKQHLAELHDRGLIYYGVHESPQALMTCFVEHIGGGGHIHFIDGSDGGYALAAQQMKKQIQNAKKPAA